MSIYIIELELKKRKDMKNKKFNLSFDIAVLSMAIALLNALLYFLYETTFIKITLLVSLISFASAATILLIISTKEKKQKLYLGTIAFICYKIHESLTDEDNEYQNEEDKKQQNDEQSVEMKNNPIKWISMIVFFFDGILFTTMFILNIISP